MKFIKLPSKRRLANVKPKIEINKFRGESITYEGIGTTKKWERVESYGPKFVEFSSTNFKRYFSLFYEKSLLF